MNSLTCSSCSFVLRLTVGLLAVLLLAVGCEDGESRPKAWKSVSLEGQPALFEKRHGHPALSELEGLYLGQPHDEAMSALRSYCKHPVRRGTGLFGGEAYFMGCRLENRAPLSFVRIGFWPRLDERVATLELKRSNVAPDVVHKRFRAILEDQDPEETLQTRLLQVVGERYRINADWDDGLDGETHLVVGFSPDIDLDQLD